MPAQGLELSGRPSREDQIDVPQGWIESRRTEPPIVVEPAQTRSPRSVGRSGGRDGAGVRKPSQLASLENCEPNFRFGVESGDIKLDRLSARGLAQAVQSLLEDRSDPIPQIVERRLHAEPRSSRSASANCSLAMPLPATRGSRGLPQPRSLPRSLIWVSLAPNSHPPPPFLF